MFIKTMNKIVKVCKIDTSNIHDEYIHINNLKIITHTEPFLMKFTYHGKFNITLNTNGICLSYCYKDNKIVISTIYNMLQISKNNMIAKLLLLNNNNMNYDNYSVVNKDKITTIKSDINILSYDINTPYEESSSMTYYRVKFLDKLEAIYDLNSFKIFYDVNNLGRYEMSYENNKLVINLITDNNNNVIKNCFLFHKTLDQRNPSNDYYKKTFFDNFNNQYYFRIYNNGFKYYLCLKYNNNKRKFGLTYDNISKKFYLSLQHRSLHYSSTIEELVNNLDKNFFYYMFNKFY